MHEQEPDYDDVRLSIRTTKDTKIRIARAAAHHGMSLSKYMKMCTIEHMRSHDLWALRGRVNQQTPGKEIRPRLSTIQGAVDPDEQAGRFL